MQRLTITIDGPAGAGKSTVAQALANHLGLAYLNSGALYRAVAWTVSKNQVNPDDENAILSLCKKTKFLLSDNAGTQTVEVDGEALTNELRTPHISTIASKISPHPNVRAFLLPLQRNFGEKNGIVAEGRDMGTHVFVDADIKLFLTASPAIRAQRRFHEMQRAQVSISCEKIQTDLLERDTRDTTRSAAPLEAASDATIIDTTNLSESQVIDTILELIRESQLRHRANPQFPGTLEEKSSAPY